MEKKENVMNEEKISGMENAAKHKGVTTVDNVADEYELSAFEGSVSSASGISTQKLFKTKYTIQRSEYISASGERRANYAIAFLTQINGQKIKSVLRITPRKKGGTNLQDIMKLIMSAPGEHKLEVMKTVNRSSDATTVIYSMQASCLTDDGVPFVCPLEPVGVSDKAIWENFKRQMIARGDIE